ncbi:alpha-galactosidase [Leifsonia poae]|uniref:alpha-galactosidase n=1 Tax=Leifsonia poae TaxID=110933 RepID=UPI001CBFCC4B|nr:alpha-galactosidase [Leifsonia poae]
MDIREHLLCLTGGSTTVVIDARGGGLPTIAHWGRELGAVDPDTVRSLADAALPARVDNLIDDSISASLVPENRTGWVGTPGLLGSRGGRAWATSFRVTSAGAAPLSAETRMTGTADVDIVTGPVRLHFDAEDSAAALGLHLRIELTASGVLQLSATVTNRGDDRYDLGGLELLLPVPGRATQIFDLAGRWSRERVPQRHEFTIGGHLREGRRGRTGPDAATVLTVGEAEFDFATGEVWGVHLGFSGNHRYRAERTSDGQRLIGGGELLLPGEIALEPGESYASPTLYAGTATGLDALAHDFHALLRERPAHPRSARPVNLNVWEAVYFDHDIAKLTALAAVASEVGVERFVLDDGWFRNRRHDRAGLGDWFVDETVWPLGLHPLVDEVRRLGMGFGLWFEPEMISPDSDLARAHPDWIMRTGDRLPPESRAQQVLDLTNPEAYAYILGRLQSIVSEFEIDYIKWDHNRDLVEAGRGPSGTPGVHAQTLAVYRLLDEVRALFPALEIESCSSGGARVDLGILERTDRVWASDCIDPLERQGVQRWTSQLIPLELIGSHIASERSHTTGRMHTLGFRAVTALYGHLGIEWDLTTLSPHDRSELAGWVAVYKRWRPLLHSGELIRSHDGAGARWTTGVVARDRREALFSVVMLARSDESPMERLRLRGLDTDLTYRVDIIDPSSVLAGTDLPPWLQEENPAVERRFTGRMLESVGLQFPALLPESGVLLRVAVDEDAG